jgi:hypothetical protein
MRRAVNVYRLSAFSFVRKKADSPAPDSLLSSYVPNVLIVGGVMPTYPIGSPLALF